MDFYSNSQAYQFSKGAKCIETYDFDRQIDKLLKLLQKAKANM